MSKFKYVDLFAGIGGFRIALDRNGGESVGFSEIDTDTIKTYCINHNELETNNLGNITKIENLPNHDLMCAGVPCQSWSTAGKKLGFADKRGLLWNDTLYLLNKSQPKAFVFENVKGLVDPRNEESLNYIKNKIKEAGYYSQVYLLNSNEYGSIQNRVRMYIIGFKDKKYYDRFSLPVGRESNITLKDILSEEVNNDNSNYECAYFSFNDLRNGKTSIHSWDIIETTDKEKYICNLLLTNRRKKEYGDKDGNSLSLEQLQSIDKCITIEDIENLIDKGIIIEKINTVTNEKEYDFKNSKISTGINGVNRIYLPNSNSFPTMVASDSNDYITTECIYADTLKEYKKEFIEKVYLPKKYRKITKEEACRIQGFPSNFILPDKRYKWMKMIGNSVDINIVDKIIKSIVETGVFCEEDYKLNNKLF